MADLHWSPAVFWGATVPEFWAAVDFLAERNLDHEDELDRVRARHDRGGDGRLKNVVGTGGGIMVGENPNLHAPDLPGWHEWAAKVQADKAAGRIKMIQVGAA